MRLYSIIKSINGGFIACGSDWRTNIDGLLLKIDSLGNLLWVRYYLAGFDKTLFSVTESVGGNLLITGDDEVTYGGGIPAKTLIMKLNSVGDSIWVKRYSANSASCYGQNIKTFSNQYIVAGSTRDTVYASPDWPYIMKLDTNGNLQFKKIYTALRSEYYLCFGISNNTYLFSTSVIYGANHIAGKVYVTDTGGTVIRQKEFNDTGQVELNAILPLPNGDLLFAGYWGNYGPTRNDFYVIRTDSVLNFPPIGILNHSNNLPNMFVLYQNYPNPFNPETIIKYDLPKDGLVSVKIYDLLGKVAFSKTEYKLAGTYDFSFNGSSYASGLYFYRIEAGAFVDCKKMVLIK